jgi:DNA-binding beta-propeller fold protein YncE
MSYVIAAPSALTAAATDLAGIGSVVKVATAAAASPTTNLLAAAQDQVSSAVAELFGNYAQEYQALSAQTVSFHDQFVRALTTAGGAYGGTEAANVLSLSDLQQAVANVVNPPARALLGHPLIAERATPSVAGTSGPSGSVTGANTTAGSSAGATTASAGGSAASAGGTSAATQNPVTATVNVGLASGPIVASPDGHFVYTANGSSLSVVNTATKAMTSVPLGLITSDHILVTPNGKEVYVSGYDMTGTGTTPNEAVVAINTANNTASGPIIVGNGYAGIPASMVIAPDGSRIYIDAFKGSGTASFNDVAVINTATHTVTGDIPLSYPGTLAVSPNSSGLYVSTPGSIAVVNTASNAVTGQIPQTGGTAPALLLSPDGSHLYAQGGSSSTVSIINTADNTLGGTIAEITGGTGNLTAISPDGHYLYFTGVDSNGPSLLVFDTHTATMGSPIDLNSNKFSLDPWLAISPNGQYLYATGPSNGGTVTIIDTVNAAISDPITVSPHNYVGGITATGSNAYVTDQYSSQVAILNPTLATFHSLPSGTGLNGSGTPVVIPPSNPDPGGPGTGGGGGGGGGGTTGGVPGVGFTLGPLSINGSGISIYGQDLSHSLDPVTNAINDAWAIGNALLGNGAIGPLALGAAVVDAHSLGADLANGNWGSAALDGVSVVADVARIFL